MFFTSDNVNVIEVDGNKLNKPEIKSNPFLEIKKRLSGLENVINQAVKNKNYSSYIEAIKQIQQLASKGYVSAYQLCYEKLIMVNPAIPNFTKNFNPDDEKKYLLSLEIPEKIWDRFVIIQANLAAQAEQQSAQEESANIPAPAA